MFFMSIVTVLPLPEAVPPDAVLVAGAARPDDRGRDEELELPQPAAASATATSSGRANRFMCTPDDVMALILPVGGPRGWGRGRSADHGPASPPGPRRSSREPGSGRPCGRRGRSARAAGAHAC